MRGGAVDNKLQRIQNTSIANHFLNKRQREGENEFFSLAWDKKSLYTLLDIKFDKHSCHYSKNTLLIFFFQKKGNSETQSKATSVAATTNGRNSARILFRTTEHSRATAPAIATQSVLSGKRASAQQF